MRDHRSELGKAGERVAEDYLKRQGCEILFRRYRGAGKEIDLVVRDGKTIVFVEVKTDTSGRFGPPETWVTPRKQQAIIKAARSFIATQEPNADGYRFDVVGVTIRGTGLPEVIHIRNAFSS